MWLQWGTLKTNQDRKSEEGDTNHGRPCRHSKCPDFYLWKATAESVRAEVSTVALLSKEQKQQQN